MRSLVMALIAGITTLVGQAFADEIYLRDGNCVTGAVLALQRENYVVKSDPPAGMQMIPKKAVMFIQYDNPAKGAEILKIRPPSAREMAPVELLPTREYGLAVLEAVKQAEKSIWITAYYISGSKGSPVKDFYETLMEKARNGVEVVIIGEYGAGTSTRIRDATFNFCRQLEAEGVKIHLLKERRILHKKMVVIDGQTAYIGSSNLTLAGVYHNDELNLMTQYTPFVDFVKKDMERLRVRTVPPDELNRKD